MRRFSISLLLAVLLATATGTLWRYRFEHAGPPLSEPFKPGLPGWKWLDGKGRESNPDATGALVLSKQDGDPAINVERVLGSLDGVRFLHLQAEAKWTDVKQQGAIRWANARGLIYGRLPNGTNTWPKDHWLISAYGSSDWHREESVFDLVPDIGEARFALQHLGEHGTLEVRNVEINVVRQRSWYVPATAFLTALWIFWAAWTIAPALPRSVRLRPIRTLLGGAAVIAASWFLVFPQPRFCARPLVGGFELGLPIPTPPPAPSPPPAPTAPVAPVIPPLAVTPAPLVPVPTPPPPAPLVVEKREARAIEQEIRKLDERFNFLHLLAFGAFGLALFSATNLRTWPMAATVALASEALPNWQLEQVWDLGDLGDLASDFSGLALAALAVILVKRLWRKHVSRSTDPETSASPAPP